MSTEPEIETVNLFQWISERMIQRIEAETLTVDVRCADGTITMEIPRKHPWYRELSRRKAEQVQRLRASLQAGDHHKLSQKPKTKKETAASRSTKTADSVNKNESNSRTTK